MKPVKRAKSIFSAFENLVGVVGSIISETMITQQMLAKKWTYGRNDRKFIFWQLVVDNWRRHDHRKVLIILKRLLVINLWFLNMNQPESKAIAQRTQLTGALEPWHNYDVKSAPIGAWKFYFPLRKIWPTGQPTAGHEGP